MTAGTTTRHDTGSVSDRPAARRYRVRRLQGPDWLDGPMVSCTLVLGAAGLLLAIGLVMVFSASSVKAALSHEPAWAPGVQQLVWAAIGAVALVLALRLPVGFLRRWSGWFMVAMLVLLLAVLVFGVQLNGARQWFDFTIAHFQPSEPAKLAFALWGAHMLATRDRYLTTKSLLLPIIPAFLLIAVLLLAEPDLGGVVTFFVILVALLWAGGARLKVWLGLGAVAAIGIVSLIAVAPYRLARFTSFLDPFADASNTGYQAVRGLYALATGGFSGVGLGNSRMKWGLLPYGESDYIFAIIGEELGFLGCLVVVALYGVLAYVGFRIARRSADRFVQLASIAITTWLVGQATMNMGYVVGLLPVTGVTLPLVSAGGTSLVLTLFIVGVLARFALSEPAAIEAQQNRRRSRLSRWLLPVPAHAVDPVRSRRRPGSGRTVARVPGGGAERTPRRSTPPRRRPPLEERERGVPRRPVGSRVSEAATRRPGRPG
ncbi:putative lipid II flippase FtsW [Petropleomorpha daqingensis]|uniref:Probable peptidoglycan glycosyltransferase FtsW n=1 Tax=Petropleomorpha daqingensis TaxID=2026353 RepID=A0A853CLL9_9ACTN|nr:putative lipid II flippase FtsW [Petropleomorpha daqingensis]NYJ07739.1 cell division protein FtsW [Petropleomorpha daqingensis]